MNEKWPQFHSLYLEMLYFYIFKPSPAVLFSMVFTYKVDSNCDIMLIVLVLKGSCKIQIFFFISDCSTMLSIYYQVASHFGNNGNTKCQGFDNNKLNTHHFEDQSDQRLWHDQKL